MIGSIFPKDSSIIFIAFKKILLYLFQIKLIFRRIILLSLDTFLISLSLFIVDFCFANETSFANLMIIPYTIIGIPIYLLTGQYKSLTKYINLESLNKIILRNSSILLIICFLNFFINIFNTLTINQVLLIWLIINILMTFSRIYIRDIIIRLQKIDKNNIINVAIYGAGETGAQLGSSLDLDPKYSVKFYIDDNPELWTRKILGHPIYPINKLSSLKKEINTILFAIPNLSRFKKISIFKYLKSNSIKYLQIPSLEKLENGEERIEDLKPIAIEDILAREQIIPKKEYSLTNVENKVVCVTGAGGSIGSELCKQLINLKPKQIILIESSEMALYKIKNKLLEINSATQIKSFLGDSCDKKFVKNIFVEYQVKIVFHAAAYKHVSLVEENPIAGIYNNVFSTYNISYLSYITNVESLILISTDKAVRPSNLMGATKRVSELIVQNYANKIKGKKSKNYKKFTIVRFGNVLGSSGSVVPLFKKQIKEGGPLTVTHPKVTRYFMTIPEAVNLVLQASYMSKGGEVFLLEMGKPIKIYHLAKQMIQLTGLTVKDDNNLNGDIEIVFTGLKPGEKLHEELIINAKSKKTENPLIFKAIEKSIDKEVIKTELDNLEKCLIAKDVNSSIKIISGLVPEWEKSKYFR